MVIRKKMLVVSLFILLPIFLLFVLPAHALTYTYQVNSCVQTDTGIQISRGSKVSTGVNRCAPILGVQWQYTYTCVSSTQYRVNITKGCTSTPIPQPTPAPTPAPEPIPTPVPAPTSTAIIETWNFPVPSRVSLSGAKPTPDATGIHFVNVGDDLRMQYDYSPVINMSGYDSVELTIQTTFLSAAPDLSSASINMYFFGGWGKSSAKVALPARVFSGNPEKITLPLNSFSASTFDPSQISQFFLQFLIPATVNMDLKVTDMKLVKIVTQSGTGTTGTSTTTPPATTPPPTTTPPPAVTPPPASVGNNMVIDATGTLIPYVDRGVLGGNSMNDRVWDYNYNIFSELGGTAQPSGNNLNRPLWRMHMWDTGLEKNYWLYGAGFGRQTDGLYNPIIPEYDNAQLVDMYRWGIQRPVKDLYVQYPSGEQTQNYYEVEWFDHSPTYANQFNQHAISYTKKAGSTTQINRLGVQGQSIGALFPDHNRYTRFDFKLSSDEPYHVGSAALVAQSSQFRMMLTPDRTIEVYYGYPNFITKISYPTQITLDKWYSIEILTDNTSKLWIDGQLVGQVSLPTLDTSIAGKSTEVQLGTLLKPWAQDPILNAETQRQDSYKFKIDELQLRTTYAGLNPANPVNQQSTSLFNSDVIYSWSFDNSIMTLDDYGQMAEKMNSELLMQLPTPCETAYGCSADTWTGFFKNLHSVQGLTAMVEYMVGTADANYQQGVDQLKQANWPLDVTRYNYANLRASRGRVVPYDLHYVELGNEPYYQEYGNNENGFAQRFIDLCDAIHTVKSDLKCMLPAQSSSNFNFEKVLQYITSHGKGNLIAGLSIHNYYDYYNADRAGQYPLSTMAGPYWQGQTRYVSNKALAERYLSGQQLIYFTDEYNSILNDFKNKQTDKFLDAAYAWSELSYMLEYGIHGGSLFFWNSATPGDGFVNGLVGDYNWIPKQTLNGDTFQAFARYFGWGGKMLSVSYDQLVSHDAVTTKNAPRVTAISSLSADGKTLYVAVLNRDSADHAYNLQFNGFAPQPNGEIYQLDASSLTQTNADVQYKITSLSAGQQFSYTFPGYSITFMKLVK